MNLKIEPSSRRANKAVAAKVHGRSRAWILLVLVVASCGCRRVMEVSGTVQVDGKPGSGIVVMFDPVEPNHPRGVGTTDKQGAYVLRRLGPGNKTGVMAGKYAVKLMADVDDPAAARIPPKYFRGTELEFEVMSGGKNVYDIQISTK